MSDNDHLIETPELPKEEIVVEELLDELPEPPKPAHVMVDIETWGTGNDAIPISIGACRFTDTEIIDKFHVAIDPRSAQEYGLKIDADTVLWWIDPDRREALDHWLKMEKIDLPSVLTGFDQWCKQSPTIAVWGNGSTFDNVILRSAYKACGLEYPVRFWQDKCYRTIKGETSTPIVREGTHHDALDDAVSQAKHLQRIWRELRDPATILYELTVKMQAYILPDSGISAEDFVNEVINLLDPGPFEA